jgi:hypothetical protein
MIKFESRSSSSSAAEQTLTIRGDCFASFLKGKRAKQIPRLLLYYSFLPSVLPSAELLLTLHAKTVHKHQTDLRIQTTFHA